MKGYRILALVAVLALCFTLSVQAQTGTTTTTTTQTTTTDQTAPTMDPQATTTSGTSMEYQSTTSTTDTIMRPDSDAYSHIEGQSNTPVDYSKNPYWHREDWDYVDNNNVGG